MRIPIAFLRWFLIDTIHLKIDKEDAIKLSRAGWYPIRRANRSVVTNGIAGFKPTKRNVLWALMLLLCCGNWISHHLVICAVLLGAYYLLKKSGRLLHFSKKFIAR